MDFKECGIGIHFFERFIERSLLSFHCISLAVESGEVLQGEVLLALLAQVEAVLVPCHNTLTVNTRISRRVTIVTWCHNCDAVYHNCDILFVKMLQLGSEIIPKN